MHKRHLPIANPCHEDWDAMDRSDGAKRFCDQCTKHVHDLSSMTRVEAETLLSAPRDGRICIRYSSDVSGRVRFIGDRVAPAPSPGAFSGWRGGIAAGFSAMAAMALSGCMDAQRPPTEITAQHCRYEVGPFHYTFGRGEGNCPAVDVEASVPPSIDDTHAVVGELEAIPEPEMGEEMAMPEPEPVLMGKVAAPIEPGMDPVEPGADSGDDVIEPHVPPTNEGMVEIQGELPIDPDPEMEVKMGDYAAPEPCDPEAGE